MKRPTGITVLAIVFFWLALAGASNAWQAMNGGFTNISPAFAVIGFSYAVSAVACAVGFWKMQQWGLYALHGWMILCLVLFFSIGGFERGGLMGRLGFLVFVLVLFISLHRYVSVKLRPVT